MHAKLTSWIIQPNNKQSQSSSSGLLDIIGIASDSGNIFLIDNDNRYLCNIIANDLAKIINQCVVN
jgi:hypothetical protein